MTLENQAIDLLAKMKGLILTISCLCICAISSGQDETGRKMSVSTDLIQLAKHRSVRICFSHAFDMKWCAEGDVTMRFPDKKTNAAERYEHDTGLSSGIIKPVAGKEYESTEYRLGFSYWLKSTYDGAYVSLTCSTARGNGATMLLEAGYSILAWKGCGIRIGFESIAFRIRDDDVSEKNGITVELTYTF